MDSIQLYYTLCKSIMDELKHVETPRGMLMKSSVKIIEKCVDIYNGISKKYEIKDEVRDNLNHIINDMIKYISDVIIVPEYKNGDFYRCIYDMKYKFDNIVKEKFPDVPRSPNKEISILKYIPENEQLDTFTPPKYVMKKTAK